MGKYDDKVDELFTKHVKPMKLPPRLAGQIVKAMTKAAKKSSGDTKAMKGAIGAYLTERGYDPETGKKNKKGKKAKKEAKPAKSDKPTKIKKASKASKDAPDPAKEKLEKAGATKAMKGDPDNGVPKGNIDLRKLERKTLKGMAKDLGAGYEKEWSDDELRANVAKKMIGVDASLMKKLSTASADKIAGLDDCTGVLIDLTKAICITCPAQEDCRKLFEQHRADGFKIFDELQSEGDHNVNGKVVKVEALTKKVKEKKAAKGLDLKQKIDVFEFKKVKTLPKVELEGETVDNMDHKDFLRELKSEVPDTVGDFKTLVEKHYDDVTDDVLKYFVDYCTKLEVIAFAS